MEIDPAACKWERTYRIMSSVVAPRPIAWVSSVDPTGEDNLAPYANYNKVRPDPPVIMFSAGQHRVAGREPKQKTTTRNVLSTGEFVVNLVTEEFLEAVDATSVVDPGQNKFEFASVRRTSSETVEPPRVADAKACLECELFDSLSVYGHTVIFGEVKHFHVKDAILTDGEVDVRKIDAVGRLGGDYYTDTSIIFERHHNPTGVG